MLLKAEFYCFVDFIICFLPVPLELQLADVKFPTNFNPLELKFNPLIFTCVSEVMSCVFKLITAASVSTRCRRDKDQGSRQPRRLQDRAFDLSLILPFSR